MDVIALLGEPYEVAAVSVHRGSAGLPALLARHRPRVIAVSGSEPDPTLIDFARRIRAQILTGPESLPTIAASDSVDAVLLAVVGAAGVHAAMACARAGKPLLLANKESLVVAGELLVPLARQRGALILPIDSEHSAIHQAMRAGRREEVKRVILTASGGPFRTLSPEQLEHVTREQALDHPTWKMGGKITIDSATLFNKALEYIEAIRLFELANSQVEVVIHPQSIVHSMVEFVDGSMMAQLSPPDMKLPIQYALTYPDRVLGCARRMDFSRTVSLEFEPPDDSRFPALSIAREVGRAGGTSPAVMNAANEVAAGAFLEGRCGFGAITRTVRAVLDQQPTRRVDSLQTLLDADAEARERARAVLGM